MLIAVLALLTAAAALPVTSPGEAQAASSGQLQQQISSGHQRVNGLAAAAAAASRRVGRLNASIASLQGQLNGLQSDLSAKRAQLSKLRAQLTAAHSRLTRLEATEATDQRALSQQLVGSYEAGRPDLITVVLDAHGFNDLLERLAFAQRIGNQDAQIVGQVRSARRAVSAQAIRLGALSARQQRLTEQVLTERNRVAGLRLGVVSQQIAAVRVRSARAGQLATARSQVGALTGQLARLQARQRAAAAAAAAAARATPTVSTAPAAPAAPVAPVAKPAQPGSSSGGGGSGSGGPPSGSVNAPGAGGFQFPMPKAAVPPPSSWTPDDGVDISAPGGTPELAVCSGTVVQHGIGGFGPSAPVLHCDSPLPGGYDYVYYGHAGPGNWVPIGAHVSQGQVISEVGYGIVGISTGPHLEIGFADSAGAPIGPSSASQMMSLLQTAYAG